MYIYNITFVVEPDVENVWFERLQSEFLPLIVAYKKTLCRVLSERHEGNFTFSLQLECQQVGDYGKLNELTNKVWGKECQSLFGEKILYFATLMKKLEL